MKSETLKKGVVVYRKSWSGGNRKQSKSRKRYDNPVGWTDHGHHGFSGLFTTSKESKAKHQNFAAEKVKWGLGVLREHGWSEPEILTLFDPPEKKSETDDQP